MYACICACMCRMLPCCYGLAAPEGECFPPQAASGPALATSPHHPNTAAPSSAGFAKIRHRVRGKTMLAVLSSNVEEGVCSDWRWCNCIYSSCKDTIGHWAAQIKVKMWLCCSYFRYLDFMSLLHRCTELSSWKFWDQSKIPAITQTQHKSMHICTGCTLLEYLFLFKQPVKLVWKTKGDNLNTS